MRLNEVFEPEDAPIPAVRKWRAADHLAGKNKGDVKKWKQIAKDNNPRDAYRALKPIVDKNIRPITLKDVQLVREDKRSFKDLLQRICATSTIRHPDLEPDIISDPTVSAFYVARYAVNAVQGRWPEGEPAILTKRPSDGAAYKSKSDDIWDLAQAATEYAIDALKQRWKPGEPNILKGIPVTLGGPNSLVVAAYYSWMVFKGEWEEAEQYILTHCKDPNVHKKYKELVEVSKTNKPL